MEKEALISLSRRSNIWLHFSDYGRDRAKCDICGNILSIRGGNTSNLRRHFDTRHKKKATPKILLPTSPEDLNCKSPEEANENLENGMVILENYNGEPLPPEIVLNPEPDSVKSKVARRSLIWKYFSEKTKDVGVCNTCGVLISTKGGSTSNLRRHIKAKHGKIVGIRSPKRPQNKFPTKRNEVESLPVAGEVIIFTDSSGETELLFHDYEAPSSTAVSEGTRMQPWKDGKYLLKKPNILKKSSISKLQTNAAVKQEQGNQSYVTEGSTQINNSQLNESHKKTEALVEIAQNLGRIATSFEKIAECLCSTDNRSGDNNDNNTQCCNKVNDMLRKIIGDSSYQE